MDVREKLVELLGRVQQMGIIYKENQMDERYPTIEQIRNTEVAARLIAYGVTVPQWISVDDRLPKEDGYYLCCIKSSLFPDRIYIDILECDKGSFEEGHIYTDTVTHWMPLPEPPKGE